MVRSRLELLYILAINRLVLIDAGGEDACPGASPVWRCGHPVSLALEGVGRQWPSMASFCCGKSRPVYVHSAKPQRAQRFQQKLEIGLPIERLPHARQHQVI